MTTCCTFDCNEGRACTMRLPAGAGATARSCDALGVCQSPTKPCPPHTICARKPVHYFAPGTIQGGSSDLRMDADAGWVLDMHWHDWVAGLAIVIIVGAIAGGAL
jgi:hypothetical protein